MRGFDTDMLSTGPNLAGQWLERLRDTDKPVIIFTAGSLGQKYYRIFAEYGIEISCFADNSEAKAGRSLHVDGKTVDIVSFQDVLDRYPDAYVVIASCIYCAEIIEQFLAAEYNKDNLIAIEFRICEHENIREHVASHLEQYREAYALLKDERSKSVFVSRLNFLITCDDKYIDQMRDDQSMYFDPTIVSLSDRETVVDGGGYTGDTFLEFIKAAKTFERYYLCEPDPVNMRSARDALFSYKGIEFVDAGLWSGRNTLTFSAVGLGHSQISSEGTVEIDCISIDELTDGNPVTFIKMDIEGAEMEALKGAKETIQRYKPKLAICVYHKPDDLFEIPILIKELNPEYRLYLRHYSVGGGDTVCYAV